MRTLLVAQHNFPFMELIPNLISPGIVATLPGLIPIINQLLDLLGRRRFRRGWPLVLTISGWSHVISSLILFPPATATATTLLPGWVVGMTWATVATAAVMRILTLLHLWGALRQALLGAPPVIIGVNPTQQAFHALN